MTESTSLAQSTAGVAVGSGRRVGAVAAASVAGAVEGREVLGVEVGVPLPRSIKVLRGDLGDFSAKSCPSSSPLFRKENLPFRSVSSKGEGPTAGVKLGVFADATASNMSRLSATDGPRSSTSSFESGAAAAVLGP